MESTSAQLQLWLNQLQAGDPQSRERLLEFACDRLHRLAQRMLHHYPHLRRWEQTDDVLQNSLLRLHRALQEVHPPTVADFMNFSASLIRRELIDLARKHFGPEAQGAHHASVEVRPGEDPEGKGIEALAAESVSENDTLEAWAAFHEEVQRLPEEERQIVDLLFYKDLSQAEAAEILGVSERTVKRRWRSARLLLNERLHGQWPGNG